MTDLHNQNNEEYNALLNQSTLETASILIENLKVGNVQEARRLIENLNKVREDSLYSELGKLTRELHETLKSIDIGITQKNMPDVKNRLSYVMQLTEEAANKTMDGIEATIPISNSLAKEAKSLLDEWGRLGRREMKAEEFRALYKAMMYFLESVQLSATKIYSQLEEVLVAQNYQDLSGQAIKKVILVVSDLEARLVKLIALASEAGHVIDLGPLNLVQNAQSETVLQETLEAQLEAENEARKSVSGQDEVDDLLSSLGF
jgi:chemotaxis protein CheZ